MAPAVPLRRSVGDAELTPVPSRICEVAMVKHAPANSGKPGPAGAGDGFRRIVSIVCGLALGAWASTGQAWVPLANVTGIAAGDAHTCASTSDGGISIKCWGNNDYGQI